jgi:Fe2+ transport system protein FeoA
MTWKRVRQILVGFFIFVVAFLYLRSYLELVRMEYQISVVEREIAVWEERCNELLEQIEYLSSDEYVEKMAREKPGEAGEVVDIQRADRSVLQKLLAMAVIPGSTLKVEFTSPVVVFQVENTRVAVDHGVAGEIRVCRIRKSPLKSILCST